MSFCLHFTTTHQYSFVDSGHHRSTLHHLPNMSSMELASFGSVIVPLATNTLNSIMIAMDEGDAALFASCYTPDGTCTIKLANKTSTGTEALSALCMGLHNKFKGVRHWEGNVCIRQPEPGVLTNTSYWKALSGGEIISTGIHKDVLECDGETCKIKSREIIHTWTKEGGHVDQ